MLARVLRVLVGFALACFAAAATLVLFVYAPSDWAALRSDLDGERLSEASFFVLVVTPHIVVCAAVPALAAATFAETHKVASWAFYALAGIGTAGLGFLAQSLTEGPGRLSVFQTYAVAAFLTAGLVGGLVYWVSSGRYAAGATGKPAGKPG